MLKRCFAGLWMLFLLGSTGFSASAEADESVALVVVVVVEVVVVVLKRAPIEYPCAGHVYVDQLSSEDVGSAQTAAGVRPGCNAVASSVFPAMLEFALSPAAQGSGCRLHEELVHCSQSPFARSRFDGKSSAAGTR